MITAHSYMLKIVYMLTLVLIQKSI